MTKYLLSAAQAPFSRRTLLALGAVVAPSVAVAQPADSAPESALRAFLSAFENCDLLAMEAAFAPDATSFDRALPTAADPDAHRRTPGMPRGMRELATKLRRAGGAPPYHRLEPHDLLIQRSGDMAVCSFHLDAPDGLGRRTVVLQRRHDGWKIIHLHASNVARA